MEVIRIGPDRIGDHLAAELRADLYVMSNLRESCPERGLYILGVGPTQSIMRVRELYVKGDSRRDIWLEARSPDAGKLLQHAPTGASVVTVGNSRGLRLAQEHFRGTVEPYCVFCCVDACRFRPIDTHQVEALRVDDLEALRNYPDPYNLRGILDNVLADRRIFVCREGSQIVGYAAAPFGPSRSVWVHVRPEYRGNGLGRRLLSAGTGELLRKQEAVVYHACSEDISGLRIAVALGFAPLRQVFTIHGEVRDKALDSAGGG